MGTDWLAARRGEVAAEKILDAAGALFATRDAATVGMHDIAAAAGCSRATLYRYFPNREALHTAFVNREAYQVFREVGDQVRGLADPAQRLITAVMASLALVRRSPALASWFAASQPPIGGELAEQSDVIKAMSATFLASLSRADPALVARRARWLVRVITSLLVFPGRDEAEERAILAEFVVPMVVSPTPVSAPG